jgi:GH24 family phage-related lysozyme (muramidase)
VVADPYYFREEARGVATYISRLMEDYTNRRRLDGTVLPATGIGKPIGVYTPLSPNAPIEPVTPGGTLAPLPGKPPVDSFEALNRRPARLPAADAFDPVTTPEGVVKAIEGMNQAQQDVKGPAALDPSYTKRRQDFIAQSEGNRIRAYDDVTGRHVVPGRKTLGKVTVGIGFNMEQAGAMDIFKQATGLSALEFEAVAFGRKSLTPPQIQRLFEVTVKIAEKFISDTFPGVSLTQHQRLALVSLAFNNPDKLIGPMLKAQVREGRWDDAIAEILYRSNGGKSRSEGIAARRYREGAMFMGPARASAELPEFGNYLELAGFPAT